MSVIIEASGRLRSEVLANPYLLYDRLRENDPVYFDDALGGWLLTRFDDVHAAVADPRLSSERTQAYLSELPPIDRDRFLPFIRTRQDMLLFCDGEKHARIRKVVMGSLRSLDPATVEERILSRSRTLLGELRDRTQIDFVGEFALPLPIAVLLDLLGIPPQDAEKIRRWATAFNLAIGGVIRADLVEAAETAIEEITLYLYSFLQSRHAPSPLLEHLQVAARQGEISEAEMHASCLMLITAGHETVSNAIGNALLALLEHPRQAAELRAQPTIAAGSIAELLRFDAPVQLTAREAETGITVREQRIERGDRVILLWGAANRDPSAFPEPHSLDLGREFSIRHLSFGAGRHRCAGSSIARRELAVALKDVVARFPEMQIAEPPERKENFSFRGLQRLLVDVSAA